MRNHARRDRRSGSYDSSGGEDGLCSGDDDDDGDGEGGRAAREKWRRILLLIIAVTVHNIPEGLAVGVGFGAVGKSQSATFESAR